MSKTIWFYIPLGLMAACAAEPQPEPRMTPAAGTVEPAWGDIVSVAQLADAYCDHEQRCEKIGIDRVYVDRPACESERFRNEQALARFAPCRAGIDQARLSTCLDAIRNDACGDMSVVSARVEGCEPVDLCRMR